MRISHISSFSVGNWGQHSCSALGMIAVNCATAAVRSGHISINRCGGGGAELRGIVLRIRRLDIFSAIESCPKTSPFECHLKRIHIQGWTKSLGQRFCVLCFDICTLLPFLPLYPLQFQKENRHWIFDRRINLTPVNFQNQKEDAQNIL